MFCPEGAHDNSNFTGQTNHMAGLISKQEGKNVAQREILSEQP